MHSRINLPDLAFALFLVALGGLAYGLAAELPVGSATSMGPGYVPRGLALLIAFCGLVQGARALMAVRVPLPSIALRPVLMVIIAVALFAVLLRFAGLAVTGFVVVLAACFAASDARWREGAVLACGLAIFSVALFVLALGLPIPIWPQ